MMKRALLGLALIVGVVGVTAGRAEAKQVMFAGPHPIPGGGWCYIEVPHIHDYQPDNAKVMYRVHDGGYYFVGDPVAYGYDGPKQAYYGPHPVPVGALVGDDDDEEWCYIEGPHYHDYAPASVDFAIKGGVYFYTGDFPRAYVEAKPTYAKINAIYKPMDYDRPVFVEDPPPEYHGPVWVETDDPVVVAPAAAVVVAPTPVVTGAVIAPGIEGHISVSVPVPSVDVHIGAAPVYVAPEPVYVVPGRGHWHDDDDGHWHHDNGWHGEKHGGWDKHGHWKH